MKFDRLQMAILALLILAVVGVYVLLLRMVGSRLVIAPPDRSVEIVAPSGGTLVQVGTQLTVSASAAGYDLNRLEVWSDDAPLFVATRSMPASSEPWLVSGQWVVGWPGEHLLFARGFTASGQMAVSSPVRAFAAPEGRLIFSSKRDGRYTIYRSQLDGMEMERLFAGEGDSREPALSRSGALALTQVVAGQHRGLWRIDTRAGSAQVLMDDAANLSQAAWSPDGQMIAYVSNRSGSDQIWVTETDDGPGRMLTDEAVSAVQPAWSPNGRYLVYTGRRSENWDIYRLRVDGQEVTRLTQAGSVDWQPVWSPVADQIAFASNASGEYQIYVMDNDGGNPRQVTDLIGGAEQPRWSPDGGWIAFVGYSGAGEGLNARELYVVRGDGRDLMRLTANEFDDTEPVWEWPSDATLATPARTIGMLVDGHLAAAYFANMTLSGEPVLLRKDAQIDFDWGPGRPAAGLPADRFSARWTGALDLTFAGDYIFDLEADDGARLWVDDRLVLDLWGSRGFSAASVPLRLDAGEHPIRLEYYENTGQAAISLAWEAVAGD